MTYVILALGIAAGLGALAWRLKATTMRRRGRRRAAALTRALERVRCVEIVRRIGAGNIGVVVEARLREGWREELGVVWSANNFANRSDKIDLSAPPESSGSSCSAQPVALKLAVFSNPVNRARVLGDLAAAIMDNRRAANPAPLCPFWAVGVMNAGGALASVVEVMPLIEGRALSEMLDSGALDAVPAPEILRQLHRILATVEFLESRGFHTRNLDADNVIVQPDGAWTRIDFDNATRRDRHPRKRAQRLCRFILRVMDQMEKSAARSVAAASGASPAPQALAAARRKIQTTLDSIDKHRDPSMAPLHSIETIIQEIQLLTVR